MVLPPDFPFSQSNLQDYIDCHYRFLLRYIKHIAWPAVESEPVLENEQAIQRGDQFHNLVHQYLVGIPPERLSPLAEDEALIRWWQAYLAFIPPLLKGQLFPEITLSAPLQGFRLLAKYDLLMVLPAEKVVIYDWKTSRRKTKRQWLVERMQTRVYPYLLVQAGAFLNQAQPFIPEQIEMVYWFPEAPTEPERIAYHQPQYEKDGQFLAGLVGEIADLPENGFFKTPHEERCRLCTYRSLCERGVGAGTLPDTGEEISGGNEVENFDFEQIGEIAF
jgi:hypothetical protein